MGCTGSQATTPYQVCLDAYQHSKPIDIQKLQQVLNLMDDPKVIDQCKEPYKFSALSLTLLNSKPQPEAIKVLLDAGADMFAAAGDGFHSSPLGIALKYERESELEIMLLRFKQQDWDRFIAGVMQPPDITGGGVGVAQGVWVCVRGRRAKTKLDVLGINTGKQTTVIFDDDMQEATVNASEIQPIPVVPAKCKALLLKVAETSGCGDEILAPLRLLEDGTYGTPPRGWGTLAVLGTGAMGLQLFDGLDGAMALPAGAAAGAAMALGM